MINTFAVTTDTIAGQVQGLAIRSTSQPSTADVTDMILDAAGELASEGEAVGIDFSSLSDPTVPLYRTGRRFIIARVLSAIMVGRDRGQEAIGAYWSKVYSDTRESIRKRPQAVQAKGSGPDLVYFVEAGQAGSEWDTTFVGRLSNGGRCR